MPSFVQLPPAKVVEMCDQALEAIERIRKEQYDAFMAKKLEEYNQNWWRRLWRLKPLTLEQVESLEYERNRSDFLYWDLHFVLRLYGTELEIATRLRTAALNLEAENLLVDTDEYQLLMNFLKKV